MTKADSYLACMIQGFIGWEQSDSLNLTCQHFCQLSVLELKVLGGRGYLNIHDYYVGLKFYYDF